MELNAKYQILMQCPHPATYHFALFAVCVCVFYLGGNA